MCFKINFTKNKINPVKKNIEPYIIRFNDVFEENIFECSICLMDMSITPTRTLKCGHQYHCMCIDRWFINSLTCPLCRNIN